MKIKELSRTANIAWSPKQQHPIYLAAGTAAQQLDATFSTTAELEIFNVDLSDKGLEMQVAGSLETDRRFHKIAWSDHDMSSGTRTSGYIIGGTDNGEICIYDPVAILEGKKEEALLHTLKEHTGPVQAIDINNFQSNLFASGSCNSELLIWDLKNLTSGLVPGPVTNPPDQITCIKWNNQVQHILAASSRASRVVVWDLRKSEPIIKVGDQSAMFHYKSIAWHPNVATQMVIGNEDDRYPVIQMWDLRYAASPMKVFEGHSRGVMSLDWCPQDSDLLMSCGKDNRILCWNPNTEGPTGEIIYELPTTTQWTSDVQWCPRNPGLISSSSFDGHVTISTLMGGAQQMQEQQQTQVSDSFGIQKDAPAPPQQQQQQTVIVEPMKKPPKWLRPPCGARFSFGGKLVTFGDYNEPGVPKQVQVSQVVTDVPFLQRSQELENSLITGQLVEFCDAKIENEQNNNEKLLWQFLKSNFHNEPRIQFLNLLGYNPQELAQKVSNVTTSVQIDDSTGGVDAAELAIKMEQLKASKESDDPKNALFGSGTHTPFDDAKTPGSDHEASDLFDAIAAQSIPAKEKLPGVEVATIKESFTIATSDDADGLVCQALLTGNFEAAVDVCFKEQRMADGLLLAIAGGPDLFSRTQKRYLDQAQSSVSKVISAVVNGDWRSIVEQSVIENWKEALCTLVTYSKAEEFSQLCCMLGARLENEIEDYNSALICYICAGDVERMVACWCQAAIEQDHTPGQIQDLMEKIMILKKSVEASQSTASEGTFMADKLCNYASLLASQGDLQKAMLYLTTVNDQSVDVMKDRIYRAHGSLQVQPPQFPFQRVNVQHQPKQTTYEQQPQQKSAKYGQPVANQNYGQPATNQSYGQASTNQFSPVATNAPNSFYNQAPSSHYNPGTHANTFQPAASTQSNMYNPPTSAMYNPGQNMYNPVVATQVMYQTPQHMSNGLPNVPQHINAGPPMPSVPPPMPGQSIPQGRPQMPSGPSTSFAPNISEHQPAMFNPSYNQPQPTPPPSASMPPNVFNPAAAVTNTAPNGYMPPPSNNYMPPPAAALVPPPSGNIHPMSMKAVKQESPNMGTAPTQPMNFYNPVAAVPQANQQAPMHNSTTPNIMSMGGMVPTQTKIPPSPKKEVVAPVAKGPIPAEHMCLQETFDAIVERCKTSSRNPQTKRKIDDVSRKLEILYDLLRSNKVSPNVLNGLHQMAQACQSSDYMVGIQIHTHLITTGNFSEISSFMPGLKTMMQIAGQLKV